MSKSKEDIFVTWNPVGNEKTAALDKHIIELAHRVLRGDPSLENSYGAHHAHEPEYFWLIFFENFDPGGDLVGDYAETVLGFNPADRGERDVQDDH